MTGCIGALCCWRRKRTAGDVACDTEKPHATRVDSVDSAIPDPEKPPLEAPRSLRDDATLKDEEVGETEERDRRRKAAEEEQERLDFFQMM